MKARSTFLWLAGAASILSGVMPQGVSANTIYKVTNVSPSPSLTNEFYLTATNVTTLIDGKSVKVMVYMDDPPGGGGAPAQIPCPLIEANVGQTIICHFKNRLTNNIEGASVHWHGIELDNDSDGTGVTQDTIFNGQTYTYKFIVPRSGLYWYHSHMLPGTTTFSGMYGPIIVHDTNEMALIAAGVLPPTNRTFQLMMSDISFTNGVVGKVVSGTNYSLNTLIQFCENGIVGDTNKTLGNSCSAAGKPGDIFLCNGDVPSRGGPYCTPSIDSHPFYYVGKNQRVRLQLFNASISRNCYLTLKFPCGSPGDTNLYHIGGQGGLLDNAVLDGGVQNGYDFKYNKGAVNFGSGGREDVMFYSSGNAGDVIELLGNPLGDPWKLTTTNGVGTNYSVAFFIITNSPSDAVLAQGSPILTAVGASNQNLRLESTNSVAPPPFASLGSDTGYIEFRNDQPINGHTNVGGPNIGGYAATALDGNSGNGSWVDVPHPPTAVWAHAGDVLQLAIANNTGTDGQGKATHPFHLHGFSMQPIAIYTKDLGTNLFTFPYNQFVDTWDIMPGEALVFRIKLSDRPVLADTATGGPLILGTDSPMGGNIGRWLMHCHIFLHGAVGMISELVVLPNEATRLVGPTNGMNSVLYAGENSWTATANDPWLHLAIGGGSGVGKQNVIFMYDANPGPPRVGTLSIGGKTVTVTQAGTNYIKAPGPTTALATNNILNPQGLATDQDGNVYFSDSGHGAIKRWNRSDNTVTTLASGFSSPQGLALDGVGNVYFADFNSTAIRMWSASTHLVTTVFTNNVAGISGLAIDEARNIYLAVPSQHIVKKWTASSGVLSTLTTNGLSASGPYGVAVDVAGDVYVADTGDNEIKKLGLTNVVIFNTTIFIPNWNTIVLSSSLSQPWGLAVDDGGNIYIADGGHNAIKRYNYASNTVDTLISSGLSAPVAVAVDKIGSIFVSDFNHNAIKELPYAYLDPRPQFETAESALDALPGLVMPNQNLLPPFAPSTSAFWLGYNGSSNGVVKFGVSANLSGPRSGTLTVLGQPIAINQAGASSGVGTTNLLVGPAAGSNTVTEFVTPAIGTWSANTATPWLHLPITAGSGSRNVLFTYDANPGPTRTGTISINAKTVTITQAGSTYVQAPGPLTSLVSSGITSVSQLALDSVGNVLFSDASQDMVKRWSPVSGAVVSVITNGLDAPGGLAVDDAGNIHIADYLHEAIKMWRASDGTLITLVDDTPNGPACVSLDSATNVYWCGPSDHSVKKRNAVDGTISTIVSTNLSGPYGLALDVAGNIFIADTINNSLKKWNPATGLLTTVGTAATGVKTPWGVAVDGSGNVYLANAGDSNIVEWVAASGTFVTRVDSGYVISPTGVAVDPDQNLFIADSGHKAIKKLPYAFVDPTPRVEPAAAGSDSLPVVLPLDQSLQPPFAPMSSQPWLTIGSAAGGVVNFDFTANSNAFPRTAVITLLGQDILVQQNATVYPPIISSITKTNDTFTLGFTNGTPGTAYTVLFSTNVAAPLANWTVLGAIVQVDPNQWQFADTHATNEMGFYAIRAQ